MSKEKFYQPEIHVQNEMNSYDMGYAPDGDNAFGSSAYNNTGRHHPYLELKQEKKKRPPGVPLVIHVPRVIKITPRQAKRNAIAAAAKAAAAEKTMTLATARLVIAQEEKEEENERLRIKKRIIW
jgi:hypothetical protein